MILGAATVTPIPEPAAWEPRYADRAARMRASEIRELLKLLDQSGVISFAGGIPDPALFPIAEAREAYASVLADPAAARSGLQYSPSEGYRPLRVAAMEQVAAGITTIAEVLTVLPPAD